MDIRLSLLETFSGGAIFETTYLGTKALTIVAPPSGAVVEAEEASVLVATENVGHIRTGCKL